MEYNDPHDHRRVHPNSNRWLVSEENAEEDAWNPDGALVNNLECLRANGLIKREDSRHLRVS